MATDNLNQLAEAYIVMRHLTAHLNRAEEVKITGYAYDQAMEKYLDDFTEPKANNPLIGMVRVTLDLVHADADSDSLTIRESAIHELLAIFPNAFITRGGEYIYVGMMINGISVSIYMGKAFLNRDPLHMIPQAVI